MMNWIDVETTGLDREKGHLLEVGCIVTDDHLEEIKRLVLLIEPERPVAELIESCNPFVREMHTTNGLWNDLVAGLGIPRVAAEIELIDFVERNSPLCGSSVHFDRDWLKKFMPALEDEFHHRNIDVSTLKELHKRFSPGHLRFEKQYKTHRPLDDLDNSIAELKFYLRDMGWTGAVS